MKHRLYRNACLVKVIDSMYRDTACRRELFHIYRSLYVEEQCSHLRKWSCTSKPYEKERQRFFLARCAHVTIYIKMIELVSLFEQLVNYVAFLTFDHFGIPRISVLIHIFKISTIYPISNAYCTLLMGRMSPNRISFQFGNEQVTCIWAFFRTLATIWKTFFEHNFTFRTIFVYFVRAMRFSVLVNRNIIFLPRNFWCLYLQFIYEQIKIDAVESFQNALDHLTISFNLISVTHLWVRSKRTCVFFSTFRRKKMYVLGSLYSVFLKKYLFLDI